MIIRWRHLSRGQRAWGTGTTAALMLTAALGVCYSGLSPAALPANAMEPNVPGSNPPASRRTALPPKPLTFNKDIAPIVFSRCAPCHRPGQPAPFSLLTYNDVKKHARQIQKVTAERIMPPWLPEPNFGDFAGVRRLPDHQLDSLQEWLANGMPEGDPDDLPETPSWPEGWTLGNPDLVAKMPVPYELYAAGPDVYRNFVVPIRIEHDQFVRAIEFHPGNWRAVHHAFVKFDSSGRSRQEDLQDPELGFPGMAESAAMPDGHFLSWQPGKVPTPGDPDLAWRLDKKIDMVVQMHMRPTGKPESVQPSVAFYFSDQPPTKTTFKMELSSLAIDIPAGESAYTIHDDYVLPVDVTLTAILPHAHYLGKEVTGWATLPSGTRIPLIKIKRWDFSWQGDYVYKHPISLPKGTRLSMEWIYDNSTNNLSNPFHPPQRVTYGSQSTDEMGELWFQLLTRNSRDLAILKADYQRKNARLFREKAEHDLTLDPGDARAHSMLAFTYLVEGQTSLARQHWQKAARLDPEFDDPHYYLGVLYRTQNKLRQARTEFLTAIRLNEQNSKAHGNLGIIEAQLGNIAAAKAHLKRALEINPADTLARNNLRALLKRTTAKPEKIQ